MDRVHWTWKASGKTNPGGLGVQSLSETDQCVCCALRHIADKFRGKLLCLWFPLWNVELTWMSACLLWLITLAFTEPSQRPFATQRVGEHRNTKRRVVCNIQGMSPHGCLVQQFHSSYPTLCLIQGIYSIVPWHFLPADTCLYKVYLLSSDKLNTAQSIPLQTSVHFHREHSDEVCELSYSEPRLSPRLHDSRGHVSGVTQQVWCIGQCSVLQSVFLTQAQFCS